MVLRYNLILACVKVFDTYSGEDIWGMVGCVLCYLYSEMISCYDSFRMFEDMLDSFKES